MLLIDMSKAYIDISRWWKKDDEGNPLSVYAVHKEIENTPDEVSRHTLTRARDGKLEKADISNLLALSRICSRWAGSKLTIDDLIVEELDQEGVGDD